MFFVFTCLSKLNNFLKLVFVEAKKIKAGLVEISFVNFTRPSVWHFRPLNIIFRSKQQVDFFDFARIFNVAPSLCFTLRRYSVSANSFCATFCFRYILRYTWSKFRGRSKRAAELGDVKYTLSIYLCKWGQIGRNFFR